MYDNIFITNINNSKGGTSMGSFEVFSIRLKELRTKMGKTQKEFAELVGTTSVTLSAYENNSKKPSLDIVKEIAEKCKVSIDWLCGLSDKETNKDEIIYYSDIIEMLFRIDKYLDISLLVEEYEVYEQGLSGYPDLVTHDYTIVRFNNKIANDFLANWNKMKELLDKGSIDDEVYDLWAEKTLLKYKDELAVGEGWFNIPDAKDEIPFS